MNLSNYYWYFSGALSHRFCDEVIRYGLEKKESMALTGNFGQDRNIEENPLKENEIKDLKTKRNSDLVWLDGNWIYKEIHPFVHEANRKAGWNFDWEISESCQFTKYKLNQYYDWHCDGWNSPYKKGPNCGLVRKLSMTCQLTDGADYNGGDLEFDFRNYEPHMREEARHKVSCKEILPKGSIVVFPSFVWHRVKPVTKGTRYSLVVWNLGKPFK